jgi:hypothetical protein
MGKRMVLVPHFTTAHLAARYKATPGAATVDAGMHDHRRVR